MMNILCPTDFSEVSFSGIDYAAQLAQKISARLTLVNFQKMSIGEGVSMFSGAERESKRNSAVSELILKKMCKDVQRTFRVPCEHTVVSSFATLEGEIADMEEEYDLIITGTNGVDSLFQYYFGTNSYWIANAAKTPVLIVPNHYSFKPISEIILATDYTTDDKAMLIQLKIFLQNFRPKINVVHVSTIDSALSRQLFNSLSKILHEELDFDTKISFKRIVGHDVVDEMKKLAGRTKADFLTVCLEEHNVFYKMTHRNLIKELAADVAIPLLVLHQ